MIREFREDLRLEAGLDGHGRATGALTPIPLSDLFPLLDQGPVVRALLSILGSKVNGTQIFIYDPETGAITDLTADIGRGFGNSSNRYAWSQELVDTDGDGVEEIYVGTLNANPNIPDSIQSLLGLPGILDFTQSAGPQDLAEIWRYDPATGMWVEVTPVGPDGEPLLTANDVGVRSMVAYEIDGAQYLLAATSASSLDFVVSNDTVDPDDVPTFQLLIATAPAGEQIGSTSWMVVDQAGTPGDPAEGNSSVRTQVQVGDQIYIGTENINGAQIWAMDSDLTFTKIIDLADPGFTEGDVAIGDITTFDTPAGEMVVFGTWNTAGGNIYVYDPATGTTTLVTPQQATLPDGSVMTADNVTTSTDPFNDPAVLEVFVFDGELYYTTGGDFAESAVMFKTSNPLDPDAWEVVTFDGFSDLSDDQPLANDYFWSSTVVEEDDGSETLYVGTFNGVLGEAQLYSTNSAVNDAAGQDVWTRVIDFEDTPFAITSRNIYGIRRLSTTEDGQIVIGTASSFFVPDFGQSPYPLSVGLNLGALLDWVRNSGDAPSIASGTAQFDPSAGIRLFGERAADFDQSRGLAWSEDRPIWADWSSDSAWHSDALA